MTTNLWSKNKPQDFWQCTPPIHDDLWEQAILQSLPILKFDSLSGDIDELLETVLGEGQFGSDHWSLTRMRRLYYVFKPLLPRTLTRALRHFLQGRHTQNSKLGWPIEARYSHFQFLMLKHLLGLTGQNSIQFRAFWPHGKRYAFVLTHDIEANKGQQFIRHVVDLEESLGFRSSFNFVPEAYHVDMDLLDELRRRGFEIGVHGLKHDGKLFNSRAEFERRAAKINRYLKDFGAVGFRAPLTHRHPEWMQILDIEYDLSFFDTDPFEPIPGGTMSIWPFFIGRFVELPYTLIQDYTLTDVLQQTAPFLWLEKVEFIRQHYGMALVNTHPDYLKVPSHFNLYARFLHMMREKEDYWHALPRDVAQWWCRRAGTDVAGNGFPLTSAVREGNGLQFTNLPNGSWEG